MIPQKSQSKFRDAAATMENEADHKSLAKLRKLIQNSNDELLLKNSWPFTDDFLIRYIRSRGYNVQSAYERLLAHMTVRRRKNPEIFSRLYPSAVPSALKAPIARVLRHRDEKGRGILYVRVGEWEPEEIPVDDFLLALMLLGWELLSFADVQLNGIVVVVDCGGFGVKHAKCGTPGNVQKYADLILRASPFKCKGAHIINAPLIFNMTLGVIKMFLPQKLRSRIHVHSSNTSLHNHLSPCILPESLGGTLEVAEDNELMLNLISEERDEYYRGFCT